MFFVLSAFFSINMSIQSAVTKDIEWRDLGQIEEKFLFSENFSHTLGKNETFQAEFPQNTSFTLHSSTGTIIYFENENSTGMLFENTSTGLSFSWNLHLTGFAGKNVFFISWIESQYFPHNYVQKVQKIWWIDLIREFSKREK